jgi:hypothetical protein
MLASGGQSYDIFFWHTILLLMWQLYNVWYQICGNEVN